MVTEQESDTAKIEVPLCLWALTHFSMLLYSSDNLQLLYEGFIQILSIWKVSDIQILPVFPNQIDDFSLLDQLLYKKKKGAGEKEKQENNFLKHT